MRILLASCVALFVTIGIAYSITGERRKRQVGSDNWLWRQGLSARLDGKRMTPSLYWFAAFAICCFVALTIGFIIAFGRL